jgi:hypothetical protein
MKGMILWITALMLPLPLMIGWAGSAAGTRLLRIPAVFVAFIYLFVWVYMRPTAFELTAESLDIVWPLRRQSTPLTTVESVKKLSGPEFRQRYGYGYRIGAGGLWGGFGLYKTKTVTFQFYVSHLDHYVLVERANDRPLLITPDDPDRLVAELAALTSGNAA